MSKSMSAPAKSLVGPMEELYLVAFLAEGDEQIKIEKALRAWADKWLIAYEYTEAIDQDALNQMSEDEKKKHNLDLLIKTKQQLGEALAATTTTYREGPLNDLNTIRVGSGPTVNYRHWTLYGVRRWEK